MDRDHRRNRYKKPADLYDRGGKEMAFNKELKFGAGGLLGSMGAGTNRMNVYTVNKATQGLCNYLRSQERLIFIAIGYDSGINSEQLARSAAEVIAGSGAKAYVFTELMPNPAMFYAVLELGCDAGIVITESHNPNEYVRYKVYGSDGCVIVPQTAESIQNFINQVDIFNDVKRTSFSKALKEDAISFISQNLVEKYLDQFEAYLVHPDILRESEIKEICVPSSSTRYKLVREFLSRIGMQRGRRSRKTWFQA